MSNSAKRIMSTIGCTIILALALGILQLLSIMIPNVVEGLGVPLAAVTGGSMVGMFSGFLFSVIATKLIDKLTPRWSLLVGTIFAGITLFLAAVATNIVVWYISCIFSGVVLGIGSNAAVAGVLGAWYGENSPRSYGIVAGISTFLIAAMVVVSGQMLTAMDYRSCLYIMTAVVVIVGVLANLLLIRKAPSDMGSGGGDGTESPAAGPDASAASADSKEAASGLTMKEAMKTGSFICFVLGMFIGAFPANGFSGFMSTFFTSFGVSADIYTTYVGLFMVFGAIIVMASGFFIKKYGAGKLIPIMFIAFAIGIALLVAWTGNQSAGWLPILAVLFASFITLTMNLPGLIVPEVFGMRDYSAITAAGMAAFFIGAGLMMLIIALVAEAFGMTVAYIVFGVLGLIAMVLFIASLAASPMKKVEEEK
ncbi:MAG: MFS transporter [Coriobacteriales bacterium]